MAGPYFEVDALIREAERIAGSSDWGGDEFRAPFEVFVKSLNDEADLSDLGVARAKSHIMKLMTGRLRLHADRKRFPGIVDEQIRAPFFIAGHGRSGTSYLNALLASDDRNHAPRHWQIWTLSPPVNFPDTDNASQIAQGEHFMQFEGWQADDVREKHDYSNEGVAEDTLITDYSFVGKSFPFFWNVPSYGRWLFQDGDAGAGYRIERKILQALQYGQKRDQWVLKNPLHLGQLDHLFAEFPDARMIINHRDPVKSMASIIGLLYAHRKQFGNRFIEFGRDFVLASMEGTVANTRAMMRWREDAEKNARFVDVLYLDLERDPLGQVARIYDHHGIEFTARARAAMEAYIAENRKGKFGHHKYDIRELGVSVEEVREKFAFYYEAFGIPIE